MVRRLVSTRAEHRIGVCRLSSGSASGWLGLRFRCSASAAKEYVGMFGFKIEQLLLLPRCNPTMPRCDADECGTRS
jgi:hypothetical protein